MNDYHEFLNPICSPETLDFASQRLAILRALQNELPRFTGVVLDVGCGCMPYKTLVLNSPGHVTKYIGLDMKDNIYQKPEVEWNGHKIPLTDESVDCAMATEVFEHCPDPEQVMREVFRTLKPHGLLFFTVPFLWPLHCVPDDQYRFTPFALERHLRACGFESIELKALGGWDASLAQMIGMWIRRRDFRHPLLRRFLSIVCTPIVRFLFRHDDPPTVFCDKTMITGISGTAVKPST